MINENCKKGYGSHDYAVWNTDRKVLTCINCGQVKPTESNDNWWNEQENKCKDISDWNELLKSCKTQRDLELHELQDEINQLKASANYKTIIELKEQHEKIEEELRDKNTEVIDRNYELVKYSNKIEKELKENQQISDRISTLIMERDDVKKELQDLKTEHESYVLGYDALCADFKDYKAKVKEIIKHNSRKVKTHKGLYEEKIINVNCLLKDLNEPEEKR